MSICIRCQQPIQDLFIRAIGQIWHDSCFVCELCKQKLSTDSTYIEHEQRPYHTYCYAQKFLPRCRYCNDPITGPYLEDSWGNRYCATHQSGLITCPYCSKLIHRTQIDRSMLQNNDHRCRSCQSTSINSIMQGQPTFTLLFHWINQQGLLYENSRVKLGIVNAHELTSKDSTSEKKVLGQMRVDVQTDGLRRIINTDITVLVLCGLPSTLFQGVAIHELGHAWLKSHHVFGLPLVEEEGFCEFLAYRYYLSHLSVESRYYISQIEKNPDAIYGDGFRLIRNLCAQVGFNSLVSALLRNKKMP